jgi:hypothetical protein
MDKDELTEHFIAMTQLITDELSDQELIALYQVVRFGVNPAHTLGYEKAKSLFTDQDNTKMHDETLQVFTIIVEKRLGPFDRS